MNEQIENQNVTEVTENKHENAQVFPEALPNAGLVLTLGILSIVLTLCCCGPFAIPLPIAGWILGQKGVSRYKENPDKYTRSSYSNMNAGRICSIIGVVLFVLSLIWIFYSIQAIGGWNAYMEQIQQAVEQYQ